MIGRFRYDYTFSDGWKNISACEVFPFSFQNFHENSRRNDKNIQTHNAIVYPRRDSTTAVLVYLASVSAAPR